MEPDRFRKLLQEWTSGNKSVLDQISPVIYRELRKLAAGKLNQERSGHTLQPTALVHEAYLRLANDQCHWQTRAQFFAVASQIMREILVDHARKHHAAKRGDGVVKVSLDEALSSAPQRGSALIALDDALRELARFDERKSRLIEMKYFGGLEVEEIAEVLGVSRSTVVRESRLTMAWMHDYLSGN